MRVISGRARGTKLITPQGDTTRPTTDRIKETLFNMIAFDIPESECLDLFSGSGSLGIECLSRGAKKVVFVDSDKEAIACINKNLQKTSLKEQAMVYNRDSFEIIKWLGEKKEQFDIIFLDPPYKMVNIGQILQTIIQHQLLKDKGMLILERGSKQEILVPKELSMFKEKVYKTTTMSFYERTDNT